MSPFGSLRGHYSLQTALAVKFDLRFEISDPNYLLIDVQDKFNLMIPRCGCNNKTITYMMMTWDLDGDGLLLPGAHVLPESRRGQDFPVDEDEFAPEHDPLQLALHLHAREGGPPGSGNWKISDPFPKV